MQSDQPKPSQAVPRPFPLFAPSCDNVGRESHVLPGCLHRLLTRLDAARITQAPSSIYRAHAGMPVFGRHGRIRSDWKNPAGCKIRVTPWDGNETMAREVSPWTP